MSRERWLDAAASIGRRLVDSASWDGERCTWQIQASDRADQRRSLAQAATGNLYQGTAGIALFLAELARTTGDADAARAARGGLRHAVDYGDASPVTAFGFHTGRVGIAWTAARLAEQLDDATLRDDAWRLIEPLIGYEAHDQGLDVIGGAAGAVPALLDLDTLLDRPEPAAMARRLGDHLVRTAHREPGGWSWPMMTDTVARHLTGLAHGAAGAGLACLELALATGEPRFRFAAEMAFLYERQFFDPEVSNWPDWRNGALHNFLYYEGRRDELLRLARAGALPPNRRHFMVAWCHGSPGIGLSRLRAWELTGHAIYRREVEAAVDSTLRSLVGGALDASNFSLCHGHAGNAELPLAAAEALDRPDWRQRAEAVADHGLDRYERTGTPWPCGTVNEALDPSLMLGEAGIGLFYLRLADPAVVLPLLLRPAVEPTAIPFEDADPDALAALAEASADEFFGTSRRVAERLTGVPVVVPPPAADEPLDETPAVTLRRALVARRDAADDAERALLDDAFAVDTARWEATLALDDFTAEFVHGLTHRPWDAITPERERFVRAAGSRLLARERDWSAWADGLDDAPPPVGDTTHLLLYRRDQRIQSQPVGAFAALLLDALAEPLDLDALVDRVAESVDAAIERRVLAARVLPQLEALYRAGFVAGENPAAQMPAAESPAVESPDAPATPRHLAVHDG